MRSRTAILALVLAACGGSNPPPLTPQDGGVATTPDGPVLGPDGGPVGDVDGGPVVIPPSDPQFRFVTPQNQTVRVDARSLQFATVLAGSYAGLTRVRDDNPWDLFDPVTGRYVAQYSGNGGQYLWSVAGDAPKRVEFDQIDQTSVFKGAISWGVLSADGKLVYLSTPSGAFVAVRKGAGLEFSALKPVGQGVKMVHDVSRDDKRAVASGNRAIKWGSQTNVVCPRLVTVFDVNTDGTLGADKNADYPPLQSDYVQSPHFLADSRSLVYEGDDDINTGDHLYTFSVGGSQVELRPQPLVDRDFNTPCALPDDRVLFWEADSSSVYTLRIFDPKASTTVTGRAQGYPFSGYVRCR